MGKACGSPPETGLRIHMGATRTLFLFVGASVRISIGEGGDILLSSVTAIAFEGR